MNRIESEEVSNDTSLISELLNSAESIKTPTVPTDASTIKMPLKQTHELQFVSNMVGVSATFCDATNQNVMVSLQQDHGMIDGAVLNSRYSDVEDLNKIHFRHVHIPYILNGELYQIQTQDGENVTVKCCHCPPDRVYRGSVRSTGNFHMHIKRRHPDLLEKLHDMKVNALLERRDRLMRSRKIGHRNNRNRSINVVNSIEEKPELIASPGSQIPLDSTSESNLMHTHKLKIKTVFQRHQMQQREAAEIQNWKNIAEYVVMPINKTSTDEEPEQPINYSLKPQENRETLEIFSPDFSNTYQQAQQQQELRKPHDITIETSFDTFNKLNNQPSNLSSTNNDTEQNKIICENPQNNRNLSTSSISASCSSVMSNYSTRHQYGIETNRLYNNFYLQHHNLSIIKPEHLSLTAETEAIDLTMHNDSGIFSNSEDSASESNNENTINSNRSGSQESNTVNITTIDAEGSSVGNTNIAKWQDLIMQVENSLCGIQREMNVRNQIESNRMFLDIAKFKFLNPAFQYNW